MMLTDNEGPKVENLEGLNLLWYSCVDTDNNFLDGNHVNHHDDIDPLSQSMLVSSPVHSESLEYDNNESSAGI